jgi:prophage regulatory protein
MSKLITAKKLSEILSTSIRSVWRLRASGRLPKPVVIGGSIRWSLSDIELWIELGTPTQTEFEGIKANRKEDASGK